MAQHFETRVQLSLPTPSQLFTRGVVALMILLVAGFVVTQYSPTLTALLAVSATRFLHGAVWQLATHSLLPASGCALVWTLFIVLFFGSAVEREWRTRSFLTLWLIAAAVTGLLWVAVTSLFGTPQSAAPTPAGGTYAMLGAFGALYYRRRMMIFLWTIEAQHLVYGLIAIGILLAIPAPVHLTWVAGAAVGYFYVRLTRRLRAGASAGRPPPSGRFGGLE